MTDPHAGAHAMPAHGHEAHAGPRFQDYMRTFYLLLVLTVASYVVYVTMHDPHGSNVGAAGIIMVLAVIKSSLVISIFMHLLFDFKKLYGIIIPVVILCIMATFIFLVDQVMPWRRMHAAEQQSTQQELPPARH
jgi:heme/copper-type cytochrome/quinol oxidase subunit 4